MDLNSPETLEKIYIKNPFHGIINCAAYTQVDLAESEKQKAISVNLKGVENLIDFTLSRQIKIIHFSTDFVFDGMQKRLYNETDIPRPLSVYGQTKRAGEQLLKLWINLPQSFERLGCLVLMGEILSKQF